MFVVRLDRNGKVVLIIASRSSRMRIGGSVSMAVRRASFPPTMYNSMSSRPVSFSWYTKQSRCHMLVECERFEGEHEARDFAKENKRTMKYTGLVSQRNEVL